MNKVLITGISGSGGSYLADYFVNNQPNLEVHGISRWHTKNVFKNLIQLARKVKVHECDLNDFSSILDVLNLVKPDFIFHLASHANVKASFSTPIAVMQNNIMGTLNLLEAIRKSLSSRPIIQICSSSEVYGQVDPKNVPIKESCPLRPASPYAISKTAQDLIGHTYHVNYDMQIVITRMFSYINPRRSDLFATSFAMQVARIEAGLQDELLHGNLDSTRTMIDVRDAMEAYWIAANKCCFGEAYNIGGTTVVTVGEFLDRLKSLAKCPIRSKLDQNLLRPTDVTLQIPDTSKFTDKTGWQPKYSFDDSIKFLLDHCREEVDQ